MCAQIPLKLAANTQNQGQAVKMPAPRAINGQSSGGSKAVKPKLFVMGVTVRLPNRLVSWLGVIYTVINAPRISFKPKIYLSQYLVNSQAGEIASPAF
jgi:hypothetical protein